MPGRSRRSSFERRLATRSDLSQRSGDWNRAARMAGSRPPTAPISAENARPPTSRAGVILNLNATSLKLLKLVVPVDKP